MKPKIHRSWNPKTGKFYWNCDLIRGDAWTGRISAEGHQLNRAAMAWCYQQNDKESQNDKRTTDSLLQNS